MALKLDPGKLIESAIAIAIGVGVFPVISDAITNANLSGMSSTFGNMIPWVYLAGIVIATVYIYVK